MTGCKGPAWEVDDFSDCFRQRYLQEAPLVLGGAASLAVLAYRISKRRQPGVEKGTETEPLIQRQQEQVLEEEDNFVEQHKATYGAVLGLGVTNDDDSEHSHVDPPKSSHIITEVSRNHTERVRVALEAISVTTMFGLSTIAAIYPGIYNEWVFTPSFPVALVGFWLYALGLVGARLLITKCAITNGLWYHSTALYPIAWTFATVQLRTALNHPFSAQSKKFYIAQSVLTTLLVYLNFSAKVGDKPARVYMTRGAATQPGIQPISSIFQLMTFSYLDGLIWTGYHRALELADVWELREQDHAFYVLRKFHKIKGYSWFGTQLFVHFKKELSLTGLYAMIFSVLNFAPAMLLKSILMYVENPESTPRSVAWLFVYAIFFSAVFNNIISGQALYIGRVICIRLRALIIGEVYAKALRRKAASSGDGSLGEGNAKGQANIGAIINLMAIDTFKVAELSGYLHYFVSALIQIVVAVVLLYNVLDKSALLGAAGMCCISPLNYWFSRRFSKIQKQMMAITDQRVEKTNEVLQCIRIIKFFAWEDKFAEQINEVRQRELETLKRRYIMWAFGQCLFYGAPLLVTAISFGSFTLIQERELTSALAFTALALFNILRAPMDQLADMLSNVLQAQVSIDRLHQFLTEGETEKYKQLSSPRGVNSPLVGFENASFCWGTNSGYNFKLQDLSVTFPVGKMTVIAGPTGSGKTSMLMALLGEMQLDKGAVFLPGSGGGGASSREGAKPDPNTGFTETVAYCAQQAWLLNDTVQNNILFASEWDEQRYYAVLDACALRRDLEILDFGDQTEVGEKGITLSGGQKQRISLARAIYSRSRHLLLDDCLSAVDSDTALVIYQTCLCGELAANRTVLLVSHNVSLTVGGANHVVLVDNGRVKAQGSPQELVDAGELRPEYIRQNSDSNNVTRVSSATKIPPQQTEEEPLKEQKPKQKLVREEERVRGTVDKSVYLKYLTSMGKYWYWVGFVGILLLQRSADVLQSWWLREWTVKGMTAQGVMTVASQFDGYANHLLVQAAQEIMAEKHGSKYYLALYMLIGLVNIIISSSKEIFVYIGSISASQKIFTTMMHRVLHARSRFFDSTPIGRIMNRFSKDIETIDQGIAPLTMGLFRFILSAATTAMLIAAITPSFLFASVFIFTAYWYIGMLYLSSSRELNRMDSISRSYIFQSFGETLNGVLTIRAYGDQQRFIRNNLSKIDNNNRPFYYMWIANRWLSFRVDTAGAFVSFCAAALVILNVDEIDAGLAGLSLSYALAFNNLMLWAVRFYASIEMNLNSVERAMQTMQVETEADMIIEDSRPPQSWPEKGEVEFKNLSLRYADNLPLVIRNVSFKVPSFNKVGIVGRTGAGKSTIITALLRLLEADSGAITIDGLDISTIGLKDLRQALAIIPQDPTLFAGTIRSNLDPFDLYTDDQVFTSLRRVHLISNGDDESIGSLGENANQFLDLDNQVSESGSNLSQGQRQLMCLARSLLKTPRVLLLDEATASIDYDTDARIQKTIREEFGTTTLLTIAHRLRSIVDYDHILVLDNGMVAEYDEPHKLLCDENSVFHELCYKGGELDTLKRLALEAYNKKYSS